MKSSYLYRALGCGVQAGARKKLCSSSQGLRRICPAQSPEVQRSHPFPHHFTATQRTWHGAPPRTNALPPLPTGLQRRPTSLLLPQANLPGQAWGAIFSQEGSEIESETCGKGRVWERGRRETWSLLAQSLLWLCVYHDHTLTDSERSHLRVPPRSPMMLGRMAGPLSGCGIAGKCGAGN